MRNELILSSVKTNSYKHANIKIRFLFSFCEYSIVFCFLLNYGYPVWSSIQNFPIPSNFFYNLLPCIVVLYFLTGFISKKLYFKRRFFVIFGGLFLFNFLYMLINRDFSRQFIRNVFLNFLIVFVFYYSASELGRFKLFLHEFTNCVFIISFFSLFFYFFGEFLKIIPSSKIAITNIYGYNDTIKTFLGISFVGQEEIIFGLSVARNTGIYMEAPSFAGILWTAIYILMIYPFKNRKKWLSQIIILLLTVFTTFSTKGFIFSFLIIFWIFIFKSKQTKNSNFDKFIVIILFALVFLCFVGYFFNYKLQSGSASQRFYDLNLAWYISIKYKFLGAGFGNEVLILPTNIWGVIYGGNTSGLISILALGGFFVLFEYVVGWFLILKGPNQKRFLSDRYLLIILVFLSSFTGAECWCDLSLILISVIGFNYAYIRSHGFYK